MLGLQKILNAIFLNSKHKDVIDKFHEIKRRSFLTQSENEKRQLDKFNDLLNYAYNNVPYYKRVFEECGILMNGEIKLQTSLDIQAIPILTKDIIRKESENIYSVEHHMRGSYRNTSGGSTGEPVIFLQDRIYRVNNAANFFLAQSWKGADPYDDVIKIWAAPRDTYVGKKPLITSIKDYFRNRIVLNNLLMSNSDMKRYIKILNKHKPKLIAAYAQSIYEIAKFAKANRIHVEKQNAIHTAAGPLYDFMRKEIEDVFQCKAFNHYGSREVGAIASECSAHEGLHVMMENIFVEVLDESGKPCQAGEEGEIVVTTLNNYSMPLIRYKIGDIGILQEYKKCSCGCTYPKIKEVTGRTTDLFKTINNRVVSGAYFIVVLFFRKGIKAYQVIQKRLDQIVVKIVKDGEVSKDDLLDIEEKIKIAMGNECSVVFEFVDSIPTTKTGKHLYTISEL